MARVTSEQVWLKWALSWGLFSEPTEVGPELMAFLWTSLREREGGGMLSEANIFSMSCHVIPWDGQFCRAGSLAGTGHWLRLLWPWVCTRKTAELWVSSQIPQWCSAVQYSLSFRCRRSTEQLLCAKPFWCPWNEKDNSPVSGRFEESNRGSRWQGWGCKAGGKGSQ